MYKKIKILMKKWRTSDYDKFEFKQFKGSIRCIYI